MKGRTVVVGLVCFLFLFAAEALWGQLPGDPTLSPARPRVALGYYPSWSALEAEDVPWHRLTHVAHAFLPTDSQGRIAEGERIPSRALTAMAHQHRVRVLLSLGGGKSREAFESIVSDPATTDVFAASAAKMVERHNYDGLDLDWEYPHDQATRDGFSRLAAALRQQLEALAAKHADGRRYELTAAIPGSAYYGQWFDERALSEQFDFLNVMCYDLAGPWSQLAAHHAPLFSAPQDPERRWRSAESAMHYWQLTRDLPKEKLCLGIPFYGRRFPVVAPYAVVPAKPNGKHEVVAFARAQALLKEGWQIRWDADAYAPWLLAPDHLSVIAFDDRRAVQQKATWARKQGFGGMFFWSLEQDRMPDQKHWLVEAAYLGWPR